MKDKFYLKSKENMRITRRNVDYNGWITRRNMDWRSNCVESALFLPPFSVVSNPLYLVVYQFSISSFAAELLRPEEGGFSFF